LLFLIFADLASFFRIAVGSATKFFPYFFLPGTLEVSPPLCPVISPPLVAKVRLRAFLSEHPHADFDFFFRIGFGPMCFPPSAFCEHYLLCSRQYQTFWIAPFSLKCTSNPLKKNEPLLRYFSCGGPQLRGFHGCFSPLLVFPHPPSPSYPPPPSPLRYFSSLNR